MFDGQKLDIKPSVMIKEARVDIWRETDGAIRNVKEEDILVLLREVRDNGEWAEAPNLRVEDKRKAAKEVRLGLCKVCFGKECESPRWTGFSTQVMRLLH